jgi:hypothetical protein
MRAAELVLVQVSDLTINLGPTPAPSDPFRGTEPTDRAPLNVFGETCRWRRESGIRWGDVTVCVTRDGVRLASATDYHDPARADEYSEASYFQRGAPSAASMTPPSDMFAAWIAALPNPDPRP